MITVIIDIIFDDLDNLIPDFINLVPVSLLGFGIDNSALDLNFVPISFAFLLNAAGSFNIVDLMFKLLREVLNTALIFVVDTGIETLKDILHALFSFFALRWVWWLWVTTAVKSGVSKDLGHSSETFFSSIPVAKHGLVEHVRSEILCVLKVVFAQSSQVAGLF
jgi:hypothetical protein